MTNQSKNYSQTYRDGDSEVPHTIWSNPDKKANSLRTGLNDTLRSVDSKIDVLFKELETLEKALDFVLLPNSPSTTELSKKDSVTKSPANEMSLVLLDRLATLYWRIRGLTERVDINS